MSVYLDFNSSAPIDPRVLDYMIEVYKDSIGNADSRTHDFGDQARKVVEKARLEAADLLGINKDEVFFTSGATESNNIALQGLREYAKKTGKNHIITTSIEHKAIIETAKYMAEEGFDVDFVDPGISGRIDYEKIINVIRPETLVISVMHVNNETGIIQPVMELGNYLADKDILFHVDATQSFGKLVDELRVLKYDMLSMSAHKIGGPQGVGMLILRKKGFRRLPVKGIMYGGQQEHGIRPGTIPVALVAGMGKACELVAAEYTTNQKKCKLIKEKLIELLNDSGIKYEINGAQDYCVSNTLNICIPGVNSEALMIASKQFCGVSNGSACNSKSYRPSFVLKAMGIPVEKIESSIRISWGAGTDILEAADSFHNLLVIAKQLGFE